MTRGEGVIRKFCGRSISIAPSSKKPINGRLGGDTRRINNDNNDSINYAVGQNEKVMEAKSIPGIERMAVH